MKISFFVAALVLGFGLGGCASTGGSSNMALSTYESTVDYDKMTRITEQAMSNGYRIVWVHPPQKKVTEKTGN